MIAVLNRDFGMHAYKVSGEMWTNLGDARRQVRLPDRFMLSFDEQPDRTPPNARSWLSMLGGFWDYGASEYPAAGLHYDFADIGDHRVRRLSVTVPLEKANSTFGIDLDEPRALLPGPPSQGTLTATSGSVFVGEATVTATSANLAVEARDEPAPWLARLAIDIGVSSEYPWPELHLVVRSDAPAHESLNCDLTLTHAADLFTVSGEELQALIAGWHST